MIHFGGLQAQAYDLQDYDPLQVGDVRLYKEKFALEETKNRTVLVDGENITAEQTLEAVEDVTV